MDDDIIGEKLLSSGGKVRGNCMRVACDCDGRWIFCGETVHCV